MVTISRFDKNHVFWSLWTGHKVREGLEFISGGGACVINVGVEGVGGGGAYVKKTGVAICQE